jgi:hypothetical protein
VQGVGRVRARSAGRGRAAGVERIRSRGCAGATTFVRERAR